MVCRVIQRCIRKHVALTFGFGRTDDLPDGPTPQDIRQILHMIEHGAAMQKPYRYDWTSTPTSLYNTCVENAFCSDFSATVQSGHYDLNRIPQRYRSRDSIVKAYRRHFTHLKKRWISQKNPPLDSQKTTKAKHYARNSRIGTVSQMSHHLQYLVHRFSPDLP